MVIEEEKVISDYVIQHSGVKNQKKGVRRFQSYAVAPTRSGMVGEEVGEAAEQRQRIEEKKYDDEHEDRGEQQKAPEQPKKKTFREAIKERKKAKWARNQKSLYRHRKHYTTQELKDHMYRLGVEENLKTRIGDKTENASRRGMQILKNLAAAGVAGVGIYNVAAAARNAYNKHHGYDKKPWPTIKLGGGGGNRSSGTGHSAFDGEYLAHFGMPHMKWGHRYHQSYETVPTRSGMVGIEHFQKTEDEENESSAESQVEQLEKAGYNVERDGDAIQVSKFINHDAEIGTFVSARFREDTLNEKTVAKNIQNTEFFLDGHDEKLKKDIKEKIIHDILIGDIPEPEILKSSSGKEKGKYVREHVGSQFTGYIMASQNEVVMITDDGGMFGGVFTCKVNPYTGKVIGYVQWDPRLQS